MLVRKLISNDVSTLLEMATREEGFRVSEDAPCFWSRAQLECWISTGTDVLLGAEEDGRLVGFVLTILHRPTGKVTCENLFVLPEWRGCGIAKALLNEMRKHLKENGATYLHLLVKTDSSSARFYERMGLTRGFDFVWFEELL